MKVSLKIDLGALGSVNLLLLENSKKEAGSNQPDFNIRKQDAEGNWSSAGAGWFVKEKKHE